MNSLHADTQFYSNFANLFNEILKFDRNLDRKIHFPDFETGMRLEKYTISCTRVIVRGNAIIYDCGGNKTGGENTEMMIKDRWDED